MIATARGNKTTTLQISFGELRVINFNTGADQFDQTFAEGALGEIDAVAVSHNGASAAVSNRSQTTIINLTNGRVDRQLNALTPLAFSWDGKRLAATDAHGRGEVVDILSGQVIWSDQALPGVTQTAAANPAGPDLMLFETTGGVINLLVVSAAGGERTVARNVFPAQIAPCSNCSAF